MARQHLINWLGAAQFKADSNCPVRHQRSLPLLETTPGAMLYANRALWLITGRLLLPVLFWRHEVKLECPLQGTSQNRIIWRTNCCPVTGLPSPQGSWTKGRAKPIQFGTSSVAGVAGTSLNTGVDRLRDSDSRFFFEVYSWSLFLKKISPQGSGGLESGFFLPPLAHGSTPFPLGVGVCHLSPWAWDPKQVLSCLARFPSQR